MLKCNGSATTILFFLFIIFSQVVTTASVEFNLLFNLQQLIMKNLKTKKKPCTNFTWFGSAPTSTSIGLKSYQYVKLGLYNKVFIITLGITKYQNTPTPYRATFCLGVAMLHSGIYHFFHHRYVSLNMSHILQ